MARRVFNASSGTSVQAISRELDVQAGQHVYTIRRLLHSTSVISLAAGTNANLTLQGSDIVATAAIADGASQKAIVREKYGDLAVEYPVNVSSVARPPDPSDVTDLPAAVTSDQSTTLQKSAAFQAWWLENISDGADFWNKRANMRAKMGAGVIVVGNLTDGTLDPRWSAGSNWLRTVAVGANTVQDLDIPGPVVVISANPTSVSVTNSKIKSFQRGQAGPNYPVTIENVEAVGSAAGFNDGFEDTVGLQTFKRVWTRLNAGDAFVGASNQHFELCYGEAGGQGQDAHYDGWQTLAGHDSIMLNTVLHGTSTTNPARSTPPSKPPKVPEYSTQTVGPTYSIFLQAAGGTATIERFRIYGVVMAVGGYYQISIGGGSAGSTVRNVVFAHCIGCPSEFRIEDDVAEQNFYPGWKTARDGTNGTRENICFFGMKNADGTEMLDDDGNNLDGIWHYNPDTMDLVTLNALKELGLVQSNGEPVEGAVRSLAGTYEEPPVASPVTMLHDFETVGTAVANPANFATLSQHTGSRKASGAAGLRVQGDGRDIGAGGFTDAGSITLDWAQHERFAYCTDVGNGPTCATSQPKPQMKVGATTYGYFVPSSGGLTTPTYNLKPQSRGKTWHSRASKHLRVGNSAGAQLNAQGEVTGRFGVSHIGAEAYDPDYVIDSLVALPNDYRSCCMLTFDDGVATQFTNARTALNNNNLKGTFYVPTGNIALHGGYMYWDHIRALRDDGHGMSLDSGPADEPCTAYPTPNDWMTALNAMRDKMRLELGNGIEQDLKQICWSYGRVGLVNDVTVNINTTGGLTNTYGNAWQVLSNGQRVFGPGVPAGCYITGFPTSTSFSTNVAIPSGTAVPLTFGGNKSGVTVTANASDTVQVAAGITDSLYTGMAIVSGGGPAGIIGRRIIALTANTIQFDGVIPASVNRLSLGDIDHPWWQGKAADLLLANGYQSGRTIANAANAGLFTGFGLDPKVATLWTPISMSNDPAIMLARLDHAIEEGLDTAFYFHGWNDGAITTQLTQQLEGIRARVDAGLIRNLTMGQRMAEIVSRSGPSQLFLPT